MSLGEKSEEWRYPGGNFAAQTNFQSMRKITEIIIHCTATPAGRAVTAREVEAWHRERGFKTIGYHYLVGLTGKVEAGRPESEIGAHCKGHNACSIGVAYVGGLDSSGRAADTRTDAQKTALRKLVGELRERYPGAMVHGHREFAAKACPCFDAGKEYGQ